MATLDQLQAAHAKNPEGYAENRDLGLGMARLRNYQLGAEPFIAKALDLDPEGEGGRELLFELAAIRFTKGDLAAAREVYEVLNQRFPNSPLYLFCLGDIHYRLGDMAQASANLATADALLAGHARRVAHDLDEAPTELLYPHTVICASFGEMAMKLDLFLKCRALGLGGDARAVLLAPAEGVTNPALLRCFAPHLQVVSDKQEIDAIQARFANCWRLLDIVRMADGTCLPREVAVTVIQRQWEEQGRAPAIGLDAADAVAGARRLEALGVPPDAWFATVHVRQPAFHDEDVAGSLNTYRNARIETYLPALEAIVERGGWVVRIGDAKVSPLPAMKNVVDVATTGEPDGLIDVYCCARARFLVSTEGGPAWVARAFGVPTVGANWFPPGIWPVSRDDLFVPKLLVETATGRVLGVDECVRAPFFADPHPGMYLGRGLEPRDNDAGDIKDAVVEMMDRLDGGHAYTAADEARQTAFRSLADPFGVGVPSRVARAFLERNPALIGEED